MGVATQDPNGEVTHAAPLSRPIWTTQGPTSWPSLPARMSYTTLRDIEACPLRWALRQGEYAGLWTERGYPPSPAGATIAGHVVHVALERIVRAVAATRYGLGDERDVGDGDPMALVVGALRSLGGISAVLEGVIRETVSGWESNPRLRPRVKELGNELQRQLPALRPRVQQYLNRVDLSRLTPRQASHRASSGEQEEGAVRPLIPGLHAEVPLVNDEMGWYGKADLMRIAGEAEAQSGDEIVDFKTGLPKPDHAFQLRIYALLWAREVRRNPSGSRARKLTVLYGGGPVDVPPPITDADLDSVAVELAERTAQARAAVIQHPPIARPSCDACEWCDVRQMCDTYWMPTTRAAITPPTESPRHLVDAGVQVVQRQGSWSWVALVSEVGALCVDVEVGARVLLRARPHDEHFGSRIGVGRRLRIIGAQYVEPSEESGGLAVLSLTRATEAYASS
jgi:hypothetical protein